MASFNVTILLVCLLLAFKILEKFLPKVLAQINLEYSETKLNLGVVSLNFLSSLSDKEFNEYCLNLLNKYFKNNKQETYSNNPNFISYVLTNNNNKKTYISIKKTDLDSEDEKDKSPIDNKYIHKFIGSLAHDNIKRGVLITNGGITSEAKELTRSVKDKYRIILIDGITLTKLCWKKGCDRIWV